MPKVADALLMFAPKLWGQVDRFLKFYDHTYSFAERDQRAVAGVRNHLQKAVTLIQLAGKLRPNLQIDCDQLETHGFTPAANAEEIATVIEAAVLELYSTLDCTVKVLRAVYGNTSPGFKDSTRRVFQAPHMIKGSFPEPLRQAIAEAGWYWRLLHLRDELVHLATGRIHQDHQSGAIRYDHYGLKEGEKPLTIDDIFGWLDVTLAQVNAFIGFVFHHLNHTLADREIFQPCGMVRGLMLWRYLSPVGEITFDSGRCGAWVWFEKPDQPTCPFVDHCGAYRRKAQAPPGDSPATLNPPPEPQASSRNSRS